MTYTHGHDESVLRSHRWRTAENSCAYLLPHLQPGHSLLDVGCGPGTITADLADRVGSVVGIDPSVQVITEARADHPDLDLRAEDLFAHEGRYDVVHAHQVLQHLADPIAALREMQRVCRPGGTIAVRDADYAAMSWWPVDPRLDRWLDLYRTAARANNGEPDAGRRLISWAREAGLHDITPSASVWCFATPEDRAWWGRTWAERSTDSPLSRQLVDARLATRAELDDIGDAWRRWADDPDAWFAVVHGEVLATASSRTPSDRGR